LRVKKENARYYLVPSYLYKKDITSALQRAFNMIRKWKNTPLFLSLLFSAWIYFVTEFSSVFFFNENKYVFCPIFIDSKDVRHIIRYPRGRISRIHTDRRKTTKSYMLESSDLQLEVLL